MFPPSCRNDFISPKIYCTGSEHEPSFELHVSFFRKKQYQRASCGVWLEIDPGDGGAEVMMNERALYGPQALTRSPTQKITRTEDYVVRGQLGGQKRSQSTSHIAGVVYPEMNGQLQTHKPESHERVE